MHILSCEQAVHKRGTKMEEILIDDDDDNRQ